LFANTTEAEYVEVGIVGVLATLVLLVEHELCSSELHW
jgi:hypothetical protein